MATQHQERYRLWTLPRSGQPHYIELPSPRDAYLKARELDAKEFGLEVLCADGEWEVWLSEEGEDFNEHAVRRGWVAADG